MKEIALERSRAISLNFILLLNLSSSKILVREPMNGDLALLERRIAVAAFWEEV